MCRCIRKLLCWFNCSLLTVACLCEEAWGGWLSELLLGNKKAKSEAVDSNGGEVAAQGEESAPKPFYLLPEEADEFSDFCDTWYENFRKKDQLIKIPSKKRKQYMDCICKIGGLNDSLLAKTDGKLPCTCYDFLCNFGLFWDQVLRYPDSAKKILEQPISKNPRVSHAYALLFLADGFIEEFLEVATQKLSLASVWEVYVQFSKLREKLAGMLSEGVKNGAFGVSQEFVPGKLDKTRKFLTEALSNEAIIMRSSNKEIVAIQERIKTLLISEGLADEKEFLGPLSGSYADILQQRSEELENLPTLQESASKVFLPSALNHINAFEPFDRIRHSGSSDALCCFRTGLWDEENNNLQLFYFFSLENLENAGTGIAEILCCIPRDSKVLFRKNDEEIESVSLWNFPGLGVEERTKEAIRHCDEVIGKTGRFVKGPLNPFWITFPNAQGIQPLNSVADDTCSETNLNRKGAVILYNSAKKTISVNPNTVSLVSPFLFNGYYDAIEGKMVPKFINNNAGEMRCLEVPILMDDQQVKCFVFLYATDILMMKEVGCFMEKKQGEYYDKDTGNQICGIRHKDLAFVLEDLEMNRKRLLRKLSDEFSQLGIKEPDEKTEFGRAYYVMKQNFSWTEEAEAKLLRLWKGEEERVLKLKAEEKRLAEEKAKQEEIERKSWEDARQERESVWLAFKKENDASLEALGKAEAEREKKLRELAKATEQRKDALAKLAREDKLQGLSDAVASRKEALSKLEEGIKHRAKDLAELKSPVNLDDLAKKAESRRDRLGALKDAKATLEEAKLDEKAKQIADTLKQLKERSDKRKALAEIPSPATFEPYDESIAQTIADAERLAQEAEKAATTLKKAQDEEKRVQAIVDAIAPQREQLKGEIEELKRQIAEEEAKEKAKQEEFERKQHEAQEAEARAKAEAECKAKEEAERKQREEAERKAREEAKQKMEVAQSQVPQQKQKPVPAPIPEGVLGKDIIDWVNKVHANTPMKKGRGKRGIDPKKRYLTSDGMTDIAQDAFRALKRNLGDEFNAMK